MSRFLRLDHVGVVGTDLSLLESTYQRLSFSVTQAQPLVRPDPATGKTILLGQSSQHMVFRTGYVELTAVTDRNAGNHLEPSIEKYHGVHIIALAVSNADAAWQALHDANIDAKQPMPLTRDVPYGVGGVAGFKWFPIAEHTTPEAYVCATEHLAPEVVYQENVQTHENGAQALSAVYIGVTSLDEARSRFESMLGASSRAGSNGAVIEIGTQEVVLLTADDAAVTFPGIAPPCWPWVIGFTVDVTSVAATQDLLKRGGVDLQPGPLGPWIGPEEAAGAVILFRDA